MTLKFGPADYDRAADFVRARTGRQDLRLSEDRTIGLVLGSGLNSLAEAVEEAETVSYEEIPHFSTSTAPGHAGRLIVGQLSGQTVVVMQGRNHFYEGYTAEEITFPIRVMRRLGVGRLILTNAAGGVNPAFRAGDLMLIVDHLNFVGMAGYNPLVGPNVPEFGTRFPSDDTRLSTGSEEGRPWKRRKIWGSHCVRACMPFSRVLILRRQRKFVICAGWEADAVGMSTVPEALVAVHAGIEVLGISTITNVAVDQMDSDKETSEEEVMETGRIVVPRLTALLSAVLERL